MFAAGLATVLAFALVDNWPTATPAGVLQRLMIAARTDLFLVLWTVLAIADVARLRFVSPPDIVGSATAPGGRTLANALTFLQNTTEQVSIALPAHFALALVYERGALLVPVLGCMFSLGRLLFWIGNRRGAVGRALGFALTFYPTVGALLLSIFLFVRR